MCSAIALDKVDLVCAETVEAKPTGNDSGFITYSNKIYVYGVWLDNSGYLITKWNVFAKNSLPHGSNNWREQKDSSRLGNQCEIWHLNSPREKNITYRKYDKNKP